MANVEEDKAQLMHDYNLPVRSLQEKCSEEDIVEIGTFISWESVGRHLPNITRRHIRDIGRDGRDQNSRRRLLLDLWEEKNGDGATYDVMITAMLKAGEKAEATRVCALFPGG